MDPLANTLHWSVLGNNSLKIGMLIAKNCVSIAKKLDYELLISVA